MDLTDTQLAGIEAATSAQGAGGTPSRGKGGEDRWGGASQFTEPKNPKTLHPRPPRAPAGLRPAGRALWRSIVADHDLDAEQRAVLTEACRMKDRLDLLDADDRGDAEAFMTLTLPASRDDEMVQVQLVVTDTTNAANSTATLMKRLLAALRLPDNQGRRAPRRTARGVYRLRR